MDQIPLQLLDKEGIKEREDDERVGGGGGGLGRLFEGGDYSRDGYSSRKYGS